MGAKPMAATDIKKDSLMILESIPDLYLILNANLKIVEASQGYLKATMMAREKIIGMNFFEVFTENHKNFRVSFERVLNNKVKDIVVGQQQDILGEIRYWSTQNHPVLDKQNNVKYILHRVVDLTSFMLEKALPLETQVAMQQYCKDLHEVNQQLKIDETRYLATISAIPDAMITADSNGLIVDINHMTEILFGYSKHELIGQAIEVLMPESIRAIHVSHRKAYSKSPVSRPMGEGMNLVALKNNGQQFYVEISLAPLVLLGITYTLAIVRDVSSRIHQTQALQIKELELIETNHRLEIEKKNLNNSNRKGLILNELSETLVTCKSQDEMAVVIASYASEILDFSKGVLYLFDASHKHLEAVAVWGGASQYETTIDLDECWAIRRGVMHETNNLELGITCEHIKHPNKKSSYICMPVMAQNEFFGLINIEIDMYAYEKTDNVIDEGGKSNVISPHRDISLKSKHLKMEYHVLLQMISKTIALAIANINLRHLLSDQSIRDELTGLYNRRFLDEFLDKQIFHAKRQNTTLAIIMLDIDDFKKVNDMHGHEVGDIVLEKLGHLMSRVTRADDMVCRYGGEEFICVLPNCSLLLAKKRAEEFRHEIHHMIKTPFPPQITVSLGISMYPADGTMSDELVSAADKALYVSKKTGKNKVTAYSEMV